MLINARNSLRNRRSFYIVFCLSSDARHALPPWRKHHFEHIRSNEKRQTLYKLELQVLIKLNRTARYRTSDGCSFPAWRESAILALAIEARNHERFKFAKRCLLGVKSTIIILTTQCLICCRRRRRHRFWHKINQHTRTSGRMAVVNKSFTEDNLYQNLYLQPPNQESKN